MNGCGNKENANMFDDEAPQQDTPAPTSIPEQSIDEQIPDIFDGSPDAPIPGQHMPDASPETSILGPTALEAGKLQRAPDSVDASSSLGVNPALQSADLHEPTAIKRIVIAAVILVFVACIGFLVWYFAIRKPTTTVITPSVPVPAPVVQQPGTDGSNSDGKGTVNIDVTEPTKPPEPVVPTSTPTPAPEPTVDSQKDSDKDGLTDEQEIKLGTDPNNPDTDSDGLNDSAEINIWGTDPLNKDTDGDGFPDGQEVLNGFNPKGPGKAH